MAQIIAATGWTWDEVDQLTLPRLAALNRYWADHPPLHLLFAAWLGVRSNTKSVKPNTFDEFVAALGGG